MLKRLLFAAALIALTAAPGLAATCYISEFSIGATAGTQVARQPALVEQTVTISSSAIQSSAFSGDTKLVRLQCDAIASFKFGTSPTATSSTARIPADQTEYFEVLPSSKISIITNN